MSDEGPAFVDTNILVYAADPSESHRHPIARELVIRLMAENRLRLSTQVLQELYVTVTRKVKVRWSPEEALARLDDLSIWPVVTVDLPLIRQAALLARDQVLSFWDALIVVAADQSGASTLYTEDLNPGQVLLGVRVVNPFR
jgi:predicted nucleic acid-binding protein